MRKKLILLLLLLMILLGGSSAYVVEGTEAYTRYQRSHIALQRYCGNQASVHICVRAPSAIFSAFYPFYVNTEYPLFIIEYSSSNPMTLVLDTNRGATIFDRPCNGDRAVPARVASRVVEKVAEDFNPALRIDDGVVHEYWSWAAEPALPHPFAGAAPHAAAWAK